MSFPLPCPGCGRQLPRTSLKRKLVPKSSVILLPKKDSFHDAGYVGTCPKCKTKSTWNPEYIEQYDKESKGVGKSAIIVTGGGQA